MYKRIEILRKKYLYSREEISNYLNISTSLYSLYESGKKDVPLNILSKLALKYNTSIDYIVGDTNTPIPHKKNIE